MNVATAREEVFAEQWPTTLGRRTSPARSSAAKGLAQISDESAIVAVVDRVLAANAKSVADYKAGKKAAFNALIGPVMRETKGKANPQVVRQILEKRLAETMKIGRQSTSIMSFPMRENANPETAHRVPSAVFRVFAV